MKLFPLLLMFATALAPAIGAQPISAVTAELTLEQQQFLPNEDLKVAVRVVNRSGQPLHLGKENDWITFSIQGRDQYVVKQLGEVPMASEFTLESSKAGIRRANLTPYFDFRQPGRYQIVANVKIPQWDKEISSEPVWFDVISGTTLREIDFGVPSSDISRPPEMRKYILQQAVYLKEMKLYVRISDAAGVNTFKVFPVARMVTFSKPEVQVDKDSNLHVLHQIGARSFHYCVINPDGQILTRQYHDYTNTRPTLKLNTDGKIVVAGGIQRMTAAAPGIPANNQSPEKDASAPKP